MPTSSDSSAAPDASSSSNLPNIPTEISQHVDLLKAQKERIELFQSELQSLKTQHRLVSSQFNTAAQWYQQQSWFGKQVLFGKTVLLAIAIGIVTNVFVFIATIAAYFMLIDLFNNHNQAEKTRRDQLCQNIVNMEQELYASVDSFNQLQLKLLHLFQDLQQQHATLTPYLAQLSEQTSIIEKQSKLLQDSVSEFHKNQELFETSIQALQAQDSLVDQILDKLNSQLAQQAFRTTFTCPHLSTIQAEVDKVESSIASLQGTLAQQQSIIQEETLQYETAQQNLAQIKQEKWQTDQTITLLQGEDDSYNAIIRHTEALLAKSPGIYERAKRKLEKIPCKTLAPF